MNFNTKMAADQASPQTSGCGQVPSGSYYRPSPLEEMEKQQIYSAEQAQLKSQGIEFLRENPAFNKFIELIRQGSIGI